MDGKDLRPLGVLMFLSKHRLMESGLSSAVKNKILNGWQGPEALNACAHLCEGGWHKTYSGGYKRAGVYISDAVYCDGKVHFVKWGGCLHELIEDKTYRWNTPEYKAISSFMAMKLKTVEREYLCQIITVI